MQVATLHASIARVIPEAPTDRTLRLRWFVYNLLFSAVFLLSLPRFLARMRKRGGYAAHFRQRFGRYAPEVEARLRAGGAIWLHAVSVGEVYVAGQLMRALRAIDPSTFPAVSAAPSPRSARAPFCWSKPNCGPTGSAPAPAGAFPSFS